MEVGMSRRAEKDERNNSMKRIMAWKNEGNGAKDKKQLFRTEYQRSFSLTTTLLLTRLEHCCTLDSPLKSGQSHKQYTFQLD
jgi:hypothetical protein